MIPFNGATIVCLVGFAVIGALAAIYYVNYGLRAHRRLDLLLANLLLCSALVCLGYFFLSNVVPEGADSRSVPNAAQITLLWDRINFAIGWLSIPILLHFVLQYSDNRGFLARHITWVYAGSLLLIPLTWSDHFLKAASEPRAATFTWDSGPPWLGQPGPLILVFVVLWVVTQVYLQILLWRPSATLKAPTRSPLSHVGLVRAALLVQGGGATFDTILSVVPGMIPSAILPYTSIAMAVLLTIAVVRERKEEERLASAGYAALGQQPPQEISARDVFVSYAHEDKGAATAAVAGLEERGVPCWMAPRDVEPGKDFAASIVDAITECRIMVVIFSSHANASNFVVKEVARAHDRSKRIIPVRIEDIEPQNALALYFSGVQWFDAVASPLEMRLDELATTVSQHHLGLAAPQ